jgi:hypothetical protein
MTFEFNEKQAGIIQLLHESHPGSVHKDTLFGKCPDSANRMKKTFEGTGAYDFLVKYKRKGPKGFYCLNIIK